MGLPTQAMLAAEPLPHDRELLELFDYARRKLAAIAERRGGAPTGAC